MNITLDHVKEIVRSAIASATRHKPNLNVTDPDDPRYVVGADKVAAKSDVTKMNRRLTTLEQYEDETHSLAWNASTTANSAQSTANSAQTTANNAKSSASTALSTANTAKTTADTAYTTANTAYTTANTAKTTAENAKSDWLEIRPSAMGYIRNKPFGDKISQSISIHPNSSYFSI